MLQHYPPQYGSRNFHCAYCQVYAEQTWFHELRALTQQGPSFSYGPSILIDSENIETSVCSHCNESTLWLSEKIIFPNTGTFPTANSDLPDNVKEKSMPRQGPLLSSLPRAACALLRLAIEMLLNHLGEKGTISQGIRNLVQKKGLDPQIEQALEIVRVTGNNAVHPGKIVFNDISNVKPLFDLINIIAEVLITRPKQIQGLYKSLPGNKQGRP